MSRLNEIFKTRDKPSNATLLQSLLADLQEIQSILM